MNPTNSATSEWLIKHLLLNPDPRFNPGENKELALLRREKVSRPVIFIGTASCGVVSGALATRDAIGLYLQSHNVDADIVEVGCIGLCSAEPVVDVQLPGKPRISFANVKPAQVDTLFQISSIILFQISGFWVNTEAS
jgi:(2Fe-2S) ferredoxin